MWMPRQIGDLVPRLRAMGFEGDPSTFADLTGEPMGAVVWLGGCTASFVSPEGLIATNHHCARAALQYNSTPGRNLLEDGFLAKTREEELWSGPGSQVRVTVSFEEVTAAITGGLDQGLSDRARHDRIERRIKEATAACEAKGLRCLEVSFFGGLRYYELAQIELPDVRLVYAPAKGIGDFGGETDNWRWPRHTGDWSFLRAYAAKDGTPAPHSADNVPYRPKRWLTVQPAGVKAGDLVFVTGYPGRTERHLTFEEVKEIAEWDYPMAIRRYEEQIAALEALGRESEALRIKTASRLAGLHNALTNRRGMLEGLVGGGILARKDAAQKELASWIAGDPVREKAWGGVLPGLAALVAEAAKTRDRDFVLDQLLPSPAARLRGRSDSLLVSAHTAWLLSRARLQDDLDRPRGLQERDWERIRELVQRQQRSLDPRIDRALLRWALEQAAALPAGERIGEVDKLVGLTPGMASTDVARALDAYLDGLYRGTKMADESFRLSLLDATTAELRAMDDPFLVLAAALDPLYETRRGAEATREGAESRLRPQYMAAALEKAGGVVAPDANSTLRVTFGQVRGVDAKDRDGVCWKPFTTLAGIVQKNTGEGDFDAPARELDAIRALREGRTTPFASGALGDVPVDFLSTVDTTGGNSGSPTLNARGELVGLLFDGTYDTIASDFLYDPVYTRSIHVDVRYLLWTMEEVDGATGLLEEMGVK
jgi:Peptidase S46